MNDQRSSSLPDGFSRNAGEINAFEKISPDARERFAKTGVAFDPFDVADSEKARRQDVDQTIADIVSEGMDPEMKKLLGLGIE